MCEMKMYRQTAIAIALASAFGTAYAEEDLVKELAKPESSVSVGIGNWSNDRHQQGIYDGMREGKAYGLLDLDIVKRADETGTWTTFLGRNLGLDTRELKAELLRQGDFGVSVEYGRTPRTNPLTFTTGLQGIGLATQTISGAAASALPQRAVTLETTRELIQFGVYKNLSKELDFKVSFKHETKEGARQWGLGSAPLFLTEPIDGVARQLEATLNYSTERLQLTGGYYGTWYDNNHSLVFGLINGAAQPGTSASAPNPTPLSLPMDNQSHQIYLNGGYTFTPTTRGTFKLSYGKATQDEDTLASFNLATPNNRFLGAPSDLNGRIDTTVAEFGLTSQPMPKLSVVANVRYNDVKDKTPLAPFVGSNTTLVPTVYNTPHSIETLSGKVLATYRLPDGYSLTGGIEYREQDRSVPSVGTLFVPFRKDIDETTYRLQLRRSLSDTINGSIAYLRSDRGGGAYTLLNDDMEDAISPSHIADRKRDKWRGMIDWTPTEKLALQFAIEDSRDKYDFRSALGTLPEQAPTGVKDGKANLYSVDATYTMSDDWQANAWYSRDVTKVQQLGYRGPARGGNPSFKTANLKETGDSFGLGLKGKVSERIKLGGNFEWVKNVTRYPQTITPIAGGALFPTSGGITQSPLRDITNKMTRLKMFAEYALNKKSDLRFDVMYERWNTDDWSWQFANGTPFVYGTTTDGTTVTFNPRQTSTFLGARYIYRFQ